MNRKMNKYESNDTIRAKRIAAAGTRNGIPPRREALLQDALSCRTSEGGRHVRRKSWREDGDGAAYRCQMVQQVQEGGHQGLGDTSRQGPQAHHGLLGRGGRPSSDRTGPAERGQGTGGMAAGHWERSQRIHVQTFFISIGARYKRIRKRPRGKPSPQLYEYKAEKLQELEQKAEEGKIDLYYADESHVCTEGYVPYGWQFQGEDVHVPSQKIARLNIFGMTT